MAPADPARVSPTAHYTGYVWYRHGMSDPALRTRTGWAFFNALRLPLEVYGRALGGPTLEPLLLRRHRVIDHLLAEAVAAGRVGQVLEIAAGLSPRGLRFTRRFPGLRYVEGDLPAMAARKRRTLEAAGLLGPRHAVVALDAFAEGGPASLGVLAGRHLDPGVGTAVITEGLLNYFDAGAVSGLWARVAAALGGFPHGLYLADLHVAEETRHLWAARTFERFLRRFAGRVHLDFPDAAAAEAALEAAGFDPVALLRPEDLAGTVPLPPMPGGDLVRIVHARVGAAEGARSAAPAPPAP